MAVRDTDAALLRDVQADVRNDLFGFIDGVISAVAALIAARLDPAATAFMLPSHMSREPAMVRIMDELGLSPILHADMALGEGTGAVAVIPLLDMALKVYYGPHTFDDLGMVELGTILVGGEQLTADVPAEVAGGGIVTQ